MTWMCAVVTARLLDWTPPLLLAAPEEEDAAALEEAARLLDAKPLEDEAARLLDCTALEPPLAPDEPPVDEDEEDDEEDDEELVLSSPVVVQAVETRARPKRVKRLKWKRVMGCDSSCMGLAAVNWDVIAQTCARPGSNQRTQENPSLMV